MLVVFLGISAAFRLSVDVVTNNKARAGAIALANERMEYLKSLSYGQIGVSGGIPAGNVPQEEAIDQNDVSYTRRTMVFYSDDPEDGSGADDENGVIADYKTIRVEVNWEGKQGERNVTLVGRVSPSGVETAVSGGVLQVRAEDAAAAPLSNAQVDIANTTTNPAISIRTYTNADGSVTFIGAPAASGYEVVVSKPGYSIARTYAVSAENPNPDPRHLTVSSGQTTDGVFAIDRVSTKRIETYRAVATSTWSDSLDDDSKVAALSDADIADGAASLLGPAPYPAPGSVRSTSIAPDYLAGWNTLSWSDDAPPGTAIRYRVYDASGATPALVPESALPGNSSGFVSSPVDLRGIPTTTTALSLEATLETADENETPLLRSWSVEYAHGPEPLPHLSFDMRGAKTIGNNPAVYKYDETHESDEDGVITLSEMEWDAYRITVPSSTGYSLAGSCGTQPEALAPDSSQTTRLFLAPYTPHSLLVDVRSSEGALLSGASVRATSTSYDAVIETGECGQAFFSGLGAASYSVSASAPGYQPSEYQSVPVDGATDYSVSLDPQ